MQRKRYLLAGLAFGMVIGWALGYVRLPNIETNFSFLVGFVSALACASLALLWLATFNKHLLPRLIGPKAAGGSTRSHTFIWILLAGILVAGVLMGGGMLYRRIEDFKIQIQRRDKKIQQMTALSALAQRQDMGPLLRSVLEDVSKELKRNPGKTLSDTTIARIADLSAFFKPQQYIEGDSLSGRVRSQERGQLLQALALLQLDTGSFGRIKRKVLFSGADLRGADFKGLDLSGINLQEADLKDADLSGANLSDANLGKANCWSTNLNQANLRHADLREGDFSWAQLNRTTLIQAKLDGAKLMNAQFRNADLQDATVQWAASTGAFFNGANMVNVNFLGTKLAKANFSQANLVDAELRKIDLSAADLAGAQLSKSMVEENWLEKLKRWQPRGLESVLEKYTVVNDTFDEHVPLYRLKMRE